MGSVSSTLTLIDKMTGTLGKIRNMVDGVADSFEKVAKHANDTEKKVNGFDWSGFGKKAEDFGDRAVKAGAKLTLGITTPLVALGKSAYNTATSYEAAFTGVRKTTDATEREFADLRQGLLDLSERTPTSFEALAGIMEVAGQLGVAKELLLDFTEAYDMLQVSTNIQGEEGETNLAQFLNIVDGSTANIKRAGGVIVELGNAFATTENAILSMATRMAATGNLVGMTVPEIMALATVMSSLGIEAEAGGSAASKVMKQMQLAAEVGTGSWEELISGANAFFSGKQFENIHDLEMYMDAMKKADISEFAASLDMTSDQLNKAMGVAKDLEYFAKVSKKTAAQFEKDWKDNPAQSMLDFFAGLAEMDESGVQSAVSVLNEMGITEIRLGNMMAAIASRPEMLREALGMAYAAYAKDPAQNGLVEEAQKFYNTQASQDAMLKNKWRNTQANFGENLVKALQPALEMINKLLTAFNQLSEVDQQRIITLMGALIITGPAVTAIGTVAKAIGNISTAFGKIQDMGGVGALFAKLGKFLTTPVGAAMAVATAVGMIAAAIGSIPTETEQILKAVSNIQITVDNDTVNETLAAIRKVREEADTLKSPEKSTDYENTVAAVGKGFGTSTMYGNALGYEAAKVNADIDQIIADYSGKMRAAEEKIARATTDAESAKWLGEYEQLKTQMDAAVADRQTLYAQKISELFNGMAKKYPEAAQALEKVVNDYDMLRLMMQTKEFDWSKYGRDKEAADLAWINQQKTMFGKAFDLGYMADSGFTKDEFLNRIEKNIANTDAWAIELYDRVLNQMRLEIQDVSDNPIMASFFQAILSDESVTQNLDLYSLQGALTGMVHALDFKQAVEQAEAAGDIEMFGQYLVDGLGEGVENNADRIVPSFEFLRDRAMDALRRAFGIASPSRVMAVEAVYLPQGVAQGIVDGTPTILAAVTRLGHQTVVGFAQSIRAHGYLAIAAALSVANGVVSTLRSALKIHSPSKVTYQLGGYTGEGFVQGILASMQDAKAAVQTVAQATATAWDTAAWSNIALFAGMEHDQLLSEAKDAAKLSDTDIRKIRDLAEREVINHFTTAKVEVQMTNHNNITSDMDIDGIISQLEIKVEERLEAVAEGVYA